jgi:hypothetical protein
VDGFVKIRTAMRPIEIESWARNVLERVENHLPVEDLRVELKTGWVDPVKAARRIAGHANAARGERILWLIGADEKQGSVTGANYQDLASWFAQVKACFESEVPALQDLNITYGTKTVVALCFDTSRFPFLVKNPKGGEVHFEVPWRDGTAVRTATRSDLILMVGPLVRRPKFEILRAEMRFFVPKPANIKGSYLEFKIQCYVVLLDAFALVFPFHKCNAVLTLGHGTVIDGFKLKLTTSQTANEDRLNQMRARGADVKGDFVAAMTRSQVGVGAIERTSDELVIRGPGKINVIGEIPLASVHAWPEVRIGVTLVEAVTDWRIDLAPTLIKKSPKEDEFVWVQKT